MQRLHELCPLITKECDDWLKDIGFYEKPAAIKHHGNHVGGLYEHSVQVAEELTKLTDSLGLVWQRKESPIIVGLLHDVCKCNDYVETFDFLDKSTFEYNKDGYMSGHGDKSVIMLAGHIQLTEEEVWCIRFHMGAFTEKEEWKYYSKAVYDYPNVLYTHTADMIASQIKGV